MRTKRKVVLWVGVAILATIWLEQSGNVSVFHSRVTSATQTSSTMSDHRGDLVSSVHVEKPLLRYFPLVKVGETIHHQTYQRAAGPDRIVRIDATTRTKLLVVGLCSTAKYDELASRPFHQEHARFRKE